MNSSTHPTITRSDKANSLLDRLASICVWLVAALVLLLGLASGSAWAQPAGKNFDHTKTGFALTGQHKSQRCESCHINGVFKGTPRDCSGCHINGARFARGNQVMPQNHLPTNRSCDTCHGTQGFTGARFSHTSVKTGDCASCHNGITANGKTSGHVATTAACDSCHRIGAGWASNVVFDHTGVAAGTCASCHNGNRATGQPNRHVPNNTVTGMGNTCDSCHRSGFKAWLPAKVHANFAVNSQCAACHTGSYTPAVGKPANALHANAGACETCHKSTTAWQGAKVDHSAYTSATNCVSCHDGKIASGKNATHIPSASLNCTSCHSSTAWKPTSFNHTQLAVAGQCVSCHNGSFAPADAQVANHIAYKSIAAAATATCDSCHKAGYTSWNPGTFHRYFSVTSNCASCHNAGALGATQKPGTAVHNGVTVCETCHSNTTAWASGGRPDHAGYTTSTNCASCHNGGTAPGKSNTHIPTSANCISCHTATSASWKPTLWNHTQTAVAGQCATCHTGGFAPADGPVANHIAYKSVPAAAAASCDACHKAGYASWNPGTFHRNFSVTTACASCHNAAALGATQKPNTTVHAGVTVCETCHTTTSSWAAVGKPNHATYTVATVCSSCHNGSTAPGKSLTHIPTSVNCISCHTATAATWKPTLWNHTQVVVTNQCATCHTGGYAPADGPVANHIPYKTVAAAAALNCDGCHKAGYTSWNPGYFHRNVSVSTSCATCHMSATYLGPTQTKPSNTTHTGVTVCETCHKSTSSWATATFAHSAANAVGTGTCDTCHNGGTAKGKSATHIPITAPTAKCDSCHRSQTSFATALTMNHTAVNTMTCKTCHNGSYLSEGVQGALAKPTTHIPESQLLNGASMDCNACHTSTTAFTTIKMNHNTSMGNGAGWCKACHQTGATYLGGADKKSLTHQQRSPVPTDCSQSGCHRPLGTKGAAYTRWD